MTPSDQSRPPAIATQPGFVPDLCRIQAVFAVVISAELLSMVLVLGAGRPFQDFWQELSLLSLYVQWMALASAGMICLLRDWLSRRSPGVAAVGVWLIFMLVTLVVSLVAEALSVRVGYALPGHLGGHALMLRSLGVSALVGVLLLHYFQLHYRWRRQLVSEGEARLQALQSRIRPHFLFNSMNTIASLTRTDPEAAEEITQDLADLFRVSLSDARRTSTLERELDLARRYLNIEQQRLGDRLRVEWDLQGLPDDAVLPPLMLQPLLENAIYHGIEPSPEPGLVTISGRYDRGRVNIAIRNTMPKVAGEKHREGNRMAMDNIRQRLATLFNEGASLVESSVDDHYQVRMVFPHQGAAR